MEKTSWRNELMRKFLSYDKDFWLYIIGSGVAFLSTEGFECYFLRQNIYLLTVAVVLSGICVLLLAYIVALLVRK